MVSTYIITIDLKIFFSFQMSFIINSLDEHDGNYQGLIDNLVENNYEEIAQVVALKYFGYDASINRTLFDDDINYIKQAFSEYFLSFNITINDRSIKKTNHEQDEDKEASDADEEDTVVNEEVPVVDVDEDNLDEETI